MNRDSLNRFDKVFLVFCAFMVIWCFLGAVSGVLTSQWLQFCVYSFCFAANVYSGTSAWERIKAYRLNGVSNR